MRDKAHSQEGQEAKDMIDVVRGSGNVFHDFCLPDADTEQAKSLLAAQIIGLLDDLGLPVSDAEARTGISQQEFAHIRTVKLGDFDVERLEAIRDRLSLLA